MKKLIILFLFCSVVVLPAFSQGSTISGIVFELDDHQHKVPLVGVNLYWSGTTSGAITDNKGAFNLKRITGNNLLVVSYVGYAMDTLNISTKDFLEIEMDQARSLQEVSVVYRERSTKLNTLEPINVQTMTEKELFKAACCNLSESFETNPSVDVSFTDAVTGSKQIEMLGLSGIYTQLTIENMPMIRGLATIEGLTYIPGTWMNSIQVTKGSGSVINGFESIAGQINVEMKKPEDSERLFANVYLNESGRTELNLNVTQKVGETWSNTLLLHAATRPFELDKNNDTFLDNPVGSNLMALNRWQFHSHKGWEGQYGIKTIFMDNRAGQSEKFLENQQLPYKVEMNTERLEIWGKTGYVFPANPYNSIGFQAMGVIHNQKMGFGVSDYSGKENTFYGNLIFQSMIGNTNHKYKLGMSYLLDRFRENLNMDSFNRTEHIPGVFLEYSFNHLEKFNLVAGIRSDHHNLHGLFVTPRLHTRFGITETTTLRASVGKGFRSANILTENMGMLISSKNLEMIPGTGNGAFGFDPEIAWNMGINLTQEFQLDYREGSISLDFYRTDFNKQVIIDREAGPERILIYNLDGKSFSNSFQAELNYELLKMLDMRIAYRKYDVKSTYGGRLLERPLVAKDRAFINLAYEGLRNWNFDYTVQWLGTKRLPDTSGYPEEYQLAAYSPDFSLMNAQVTRKLKNLEIYLGVENILDYTQKDPILSADDPFGPNFDSSIIWGPIFGRMTYLGARFKLN
jgi:outer membrane receptor for ferrienterochelin and colicins